MNSSALDEVSLWNTWRRSWRHAYARTRIFPPIGPGARAHRPPFFWPICLYIACVCVFSLAVALFSNCRSNQLWITVIVFCRKLAPFTDEGEWMTTNLEIFSNWIAIRGNFHRSKPLAYTQTFLCVCVCVHILVFFLRFHKPNEHLLKLKLLHDCPCRWSPLKHINFTRACIKLRTASLAVLFYKTRLNATALLLLHISRIK